MESNQRAIAASFQLILITAYASKHKTGRSVDGKTRIDCAAASLAHVPGGE